MRYASCSCCSRGHPAATPGVTTTRRKPRASRGRYPPLRAGAPPAAAPPRPRRGTGLGRQPNELLRLCWFGGRWAVERQMQRRCVPRIWQRGPDGAAAVTVWPAGWGASSCCALPAVGINESQGVLACIELTKHELVARRHWRALVGSRRHPRPNTATPRREPHRTQDSGIVQIPTRKTEKRTPEI